MKNKKNKLLTLTALSMMPLMGFVALACQKGVEPDKPKPDPDNKNNDVNNNNENPTPNNNGTNNGGTTAESNFDFSKTSSNFDENFSLWNFTNPSSYKSKTAEEFVNGFSEYSITAIKNKNAKLVISNAQLSSNPNEVEVTVALESNPSINKKYKLSGFKAKEYNPFDTSSEDPSEAELINYINASISEKFEKDIEKYKPRLESIRRQAPYEGSLTESEIAEYNRKAEALGLPSYEQARLLGQVLPKTNNGGLTMPELPNPQFLNWYDDLGLSKDQSHKNHGLPRTITNEQYGKMGLQTYNLVINSTKFLYHSEAEKNKLGQALKYQEDWTEMIDKIEDSSVKAKLKEEYDKHNPSKQHNYTLGIIHKIQKATIQELIKQEYKKLGGTDVLDKRYDGHGDFEYVLVNYNDQQQSLLFRADNEVVWEKMWKPHLIKEQNKIISKVEEQGFGDDVVNRAKEVIKKSNELWRLSDMVRSDNPTAGTAFIIDFEKPKVAGQRPKKWYFATNQHVIEDAFPNSFKSLGLTFLKQKSIGKNLKTTAIDNDNFDHIGIDAEAVSLIWEGKDYLKKDPKDFVPGVDEKIKEYIDIAIFEIDFDKLTNKSESEKNDMIDRFSHGYANNPEDQIKIINYDYLNNYEKINFPKVRDSKDTKEYDTLYALGYPLTNSLKSHNFMDYELDQYENEKDLAASTYTYSLWTNAKSSWYKFDYGGMTDTQKEQLNKGSGLGYNLSYRTFKNKHGIVDSFLSSNRFGKDLYKDESGNKFYNMSLAYIVDRYTPGGGASGSSVRNQNNELVGLFHISNYFAKAGLTEAVRSNGYDYNGLFGEYNLPQYDIIYGGGKDQKTSYREALKKKYGDTFKTNLFENITEIPEKHRF
ncbi:Ig-specific serine endopeptidase MIP [Metamycoplasma spumans]|uniref:Ig-specific serine endopeptidase MIP n=1 Tax=Metamycoplasma spumans TaxID=92406 RepID=UPI0034DD3734